MSSIRTIVPVEGLHMTSKKWQRAGLLLLAALPVAVVTAAWFLHRWHRLGESGAYFFGAVGNLFALIGLPLLVMMVVLGTRLPLVEQVFGLDRMMRAHKLLAKAVVSLFLAHALLRTLKLSMKLGEGWQWGFLFSMDWSHWGMVVGRLALYALLVLSPLALVGGLWVPWRVWKSGHLLLYPALVLGFVHARIVGDDIAKFPYNAVWYALAAVAAAVLLYRVIYRVLRGRRCTWRVERTERETHDTTSLVLSRAAGLGAFAAQRAGQFATLRVKRPVGWGEPHPFTISSAPGAGPLRFTIKASGDFSATIPELKPGTPILCEGPYGIFCPDFARESNIVLIAGGVGVTPFLSAIRHAAATAPEARFTLIWGNKTRGDIIAADELAQLAQTPLLKLVHVLSREDAAPSDDAPAQVALETGFVGAELLKRHVDPAGATFYLCGPEPMQRFVLRELRAAFGVKPRQVRRELFLW